MKSTENNKLLDDFMGSLGSWHSITDGWAEVNGYYKPRYYNWNLLMEVVEKIESLNHWVEIAGGIENICLIGSINSSCESFKIIAKTKIEAVYNACVEFIKWYNEQKN